MCMCRRQARNLGMPVPRNECAGCNMSRNISRGLARNETGNAATNVFV